ncbi:AAA family ATPase [Simplicispira lacusdiani]|uniref:AAA family ATPase n=1 Tax=Simplicispira lacusdiani TaxID=2213010 RepID=UPI000E76CE90|nr:AAA family ATPase [Simplicispira lacusdiani]
MSSLYLEHFRLSEAPFGITPNGKFFFEGQARGAILEALHHAVLDDDGIITVVGEVGSGKTMLCRMLAERLPRDRVDLVYLANPSFGPREILQSLVADWGLAVPAGQPLVLSIQAALLERHAQGRRAVVLIDEAQAMPPESLEEVKLLSNLETAQRKLLQIVLFGQPELDTLLAQPRLRQVRDRVVHRFDLRPLNAPDAAAYIDHRLRRAGWQGGALFEPRAQRQLVDASGGRIRAIHLLADKALLAAFAQGARQIGRAHVRRAVAEFRAGAPAAPGPRRGLRPLLWLALGLAGLSAGGAVGYGLGQRAAPVQVPTPAAAAPVPAAASAALPVAPPPVAAASGDSAAVPTLPGAPASAAALQPPEPAAAPAAVVPATPPAAGSATALAERYAQLPLALREAVLHTRSVFDDPAQDFRVLQIGLAADAAGAQRLLEQAREAGEAWVQDRQYAPQAGRPGLWAVYAGRYASREQAVQALQQFSAPMKARRPLVRTLDRLRTESYPERAPT